MSSQQSILDEAQIREFLSVLAAGLSREAAAAYIDCPLELIQHLARTTPEFEHAMRRAEIDFELSLVARIMQASEKSPQLAKWLLERMRPNEFGRRPPAASRRPKAQTAPDPLAPSSGPSAAPNATLAGRASDGLRSDDPPPSFIRRGHAAPSAPHVLAPPTGPSPVPGAAHPNREAAAPRAAETSAPRSPDTSVPRAPAAAHTCSADARAPRGPRPQHAAGRAAVHALLALLIGVTTLVCLDLVLGGGKLDVEHSMLVESVQVPTTAATSHLEALLGLRWITFDDLPSIDTEVVDADVEGEGCLLMSHQTPEHLRCLDRLRQLLSARAAP